VNYEVSVGPLALLAGLVVAITATAIGSELTVTARGSSSNIEEDTAQGVNVFAVTGRLHVITWELAVFQNTHDDSTASVSASVLREIIASGELLAALVTLKGLVLRMEGTVVSLEVFLASESAVADITHEGLGGILGQGLLSASAVDRWLRGRGACIRAPDVVASVRLRRAGLAWGGLCLLCVVGALLSRGSTCCVHWNGVLARSDEVVELGAVLLTTCGFLRLLGALFLLDFAFGARSRGAWQTSDGKLLRVLEIFEILEVVFVNEVLVVQGNEIGTRVRALSLAAEELDVVGRREVHQTVDEIFLGVEVGELIEGWQAVVDGCGKVECLRMGLGSLVEALTPQHELVFFVVSCAKGWQRREFSSDGLGQWRIGGCTRSNREVSWVAKVEVLFGNDRSWVWRRGRRK
jgi:hypothetical protein